MAIGLTLSELSELSIRYPDSYFSSAKSFAELQGITTIELDINSFSFIQLADKSEFASCTDYFRINKDTLTKLMLGHILELNKTHPEILEQYIPEMVRFKMYEEFQTYVFSNINKQIFVKYEDCLTVEFLSAYPYSCKNSKITLLMCLMLWKMENLAIAIIKNNKHLVTNDDLSWACHFQLHHLALEILRIDNIDPGYVDEFQTTALMIACKKGLENVALELLKTQRANVKHTRTDESAIGWARKNNMIKIIREIENQYPELKTQSKLTWMQIFAQQFRLTR